MVARELALDNASNPFLGESAIYNVEGEDQRHSCRMHPVISFVVKALSRCVESHRRIRAM